MALIYEQCSGETNISKFGAHGRFPVVMRRLLRYEYPIGSAGESGRKSQVPAVSSHHLHIFHL